MGFVVRIFRIKISFSLNEHFGETGGRGVFSIGNFVFQMTAPFSCPSGIWFLRIRSI